MRHRQSTSWDFTKKERPSGLPPIGRRAGYDHQFQPDYYRQRFSARNIGEFLAALSGDRATV
jgi:hypothetical protein